MGADISMVDMAFAPFLERTAASLAYYKGFHIRGPGTFPAVERWFDAMEGRPAYLATRADYYSTCHDLPPQLGGAPCSTQLLVRLLVSGADGDLVRHC